MTTNERIKADIKKNVAYLIPDASKEYVDLEISQHILDTAGEMICNLTNLSSAGTKAGDDEVQKGMSIVEQMLAKQIVVDLKKKYNIK